MFRPRKVAIIGGSGQMGRWFARFFKEQGAEVAITGRNRAKCGKAARELGVEAARSNGEAISEADLVVISVAVQSFEEVSRKIGPLVRKGQRVIDITSVKAMPVRVMHRHMGHAAVLGTHPMFGPTATANGQNFILTPTNASERRFAREIGPYLRSKGFSVITMAPARHDAIIGKVLSLTHFIGFVTADTWKALGMSRLMSTSSTSFLFLRSFVNSIVDSSPELYSYLQVHVPGVSDSEDTFVRKSAEWAAMARKKKEAQLSRRMSGLRSYMRRLS